MNKINLLLKLKPPGYWFIKLSLKQTLDRAALHSRCGPLTCKRVLVKGPAT